MIDRKGIVERINCQDVIETDLGKPKSRSGKANIYKCPLHQESKGYSFAVYEDGWTCFGACSTGGDAVQWLVIRECISWQEACRQLVDRYHLPSSLMGDEANHLRRHARRPAPRPAARPAAPVETEPPSKEWQKHARQLVTFAEHALWSDLGLKARHYLRTQRGFTDFMIRNAHLGYIPAERMEDYTYGREIYPDWQLDGKTVRAHCGITIPHFADGQLWAVRVRRPPGVDGPKYMGIRGGSKALYWVDNVYPGMPVIITEGEFDCLCLDISAFNDACAVALCSAHYKDIEARWVAKLMGAPVILARMDGDQAGAAASDTLKRLSPVIHPVQVPDGFKDVNEFYLGAGRESVKAWVKEALNVKA